MTPKAGAASFASGAKKSAATNAADVAERGQTRSFPSRSNSGGGLRLKLVTVDVPSAAPVQVAIASAIIALFIFGTSQSSPIVLYEQIAAAACAVQSSECIEHIHHAECKRRRYKKNDKSARLNVLPCRDMPRNQIPR